MWLYTNAIQHIYILHIYIYIYTSIFIQYRVRLIVIVFTLSQLIALKKKLYDLFIDYLFTHINFTLVRINPTYIWGASKVENEGEFFSISRDPHRFLSPLPLIEHQKYQYIDCIKK